MGIVIAIQVFGDETGCFTRKSDGRKIPVRWIGEQHVHEDCGFIPTLEDWLGELPRKSWMDRAAAKLSKMFAEGENNNG